MTNQAQQHFDQYNYNVALAAKIESKLAESQEWSCVVRFYAALHLITAYLVDKKNVRIDPHSHKQRNEAIEKCPELRHANEKYRKLKDLSENIRYTAGFKYTPSHHTDSKKNFQNIISIVISKLETELT